MHVCVRDVRVFAQLGHALAPLNGIVFMKEEAGKLVPEMKEFRATYTVFAVGVAVMHMLHPTLGGSGRGYLMLMSATTCSHTNHTAEAPTTTHQHDTKPQR